MDYHRYIVRDPEICGGMPTISGTRVLVRTVLASLEQGDSFAQIMEDFPGISNDALRAVVAFAAASAREDLPMQLIAT